MMELERETVDWMHAGQGHHTELVTGSTREAIARDYDHGRPIINSPFDEPTAISGSARRWIS